MLGTGCGLGGLGGLGGFVGGPRTTVVWGASFAIGEDILFKR
jgi:hypothetical protein